MEDFRFHLPVDLMRRKVMRDVRERHPNFDAMPDKVQLECVSDSLCTGLERFLRNGSAMKAHTLAYENFLDV